MTSLSIFDDKAGFFLQFTEKNIPGIHISRFAQVRRAHISKMVQLNESELPDGADRSSIVRRGIWLSYATIAYNALEAVVSIAAGITSGSVALLGFGIDSMIEVTSSLAAQWRLRREWDVTQRHHMELMTHRIIGWSFVALSAYVTIDAARALWTHEIPERSLVGIGILVASVVVMPVLARSKRRVAVSMNSRALASDAKQTSLCAYLSSIALAGVGLNALFGFWWADPVGALAMVPIIAKEGIEGAASR
jgi:divalent metal cation (Fe/Co/Zn/Cd) transporter